MPWTCPACSIQILHNEVEARPRFGVTYRCHVCRLELVVDAETEKLVAVPLPLEDDEPQSA